MRCIAKPLLHKAGDEKNRTELALRCVSQSLHTSLTCRMEEALSQTLLSYENTRRRPSLGGGPSASCIGCCEKLARFDGAEQSLRSPRLPEKETSLD